MEGKLCFRSHSPQRRQTWTNYDRWQGCIVGLLQLRQAWKLVIKSELWRQRLKWIPRTSNHRILSVLFYFLTRGAKLCITWSYTNWYGMLWRKYYHNFQVRTYSNLLHVPFAAFTHLHRCQDTVWLLRLPGGATGLCFRHGVMVAISWALVLRKWHNCSSHAVSQQGTWSKNVTNTFA